MKPLVIVFAKDPAPGRVKTRLGAAIGLTPAAELYSAMVTDLLEMLMREGGAWDIEIHLDRDSFFYERFPLPKALQVGNGLGEKIFASLSNGLARGAPMVTVIGSDAPVMRTAWLTQLAECGADVALGPAEDGGFWGIRAARTYAGMFDGVRWSTETALADTLAGLAKAGLSSALGPAGWDVDVASDLDRLVRSGCAGPRTATMLTRLGIKEGGEPAGSYLPAGSPRD
ncbi:MAG: TIGR04282 family arsenosugar biosynthesis glycosyltransferase [Bryobacterales bacterium]|nr:TIGR04282 family arsenosugar biosynthesis glycosyltransferase [Bryobacterales bacterium]